MKKEYEKTNLHNSRYYVFIKFPEALSPSNIYTVVDIIFLLNLMRLSVHYYLHSSRYYVFIKQRRYIRLSQIYTVVDIMFLLNTRRVAPASISTQ